MAPPLPRRLEYVPVVHGWSSSDDTEAEAYLLAGNQGGGWYPDPTVLGEGELGFAKDTGILKVGSVTVVSRVGLVRSRIGSWRGDGIC